MDDDSAGTRGKGVGEAAGFRRGAGSTDTRKSRRRPAGERDRRERIAKALLRPTGQQSEDQRRKLAGDALTDMGEEVEFGHPTTGGVIDVYLPRRRTIIETKRLGGVDGPDRPQLRANNETPREQLERYVRAEISLAAGQLALDEDAERPWLGILTDGRIWHVWRYPNEEGARGEAVVEGWQPASGDELFDWLGETLGGQGKGRPWVPKNPLEIFRPDFEALGRIHAGLSAATAARTETKMLLWLDMLRTSSMAPEGAAAQTALFVAHSCLVALARCVIHALARPEEPADAEARDGEIQEILGDGFVAWTVDPALGRKWARGMLAKVRMYEWRRRPGDVMRPLYEQFVDEGDRRAFGEFYTPDWLAERIVASVCDDEWCNRSVEAAFAALRDGRELRGVGVLDPTCGSGTFLHHAAMRIVGCQAAAGLSGGDLSRIVCSLVHGIDIHPVAAEIARATLMRALPQPVETGELNVHEGDALMALGEDERSLFRPRDGVIEIRSPQGGEIVLPETFVARPGFPDDLRRMVEAAVAGGDPPHGILAGLDERDRTAVELCHRNLVEIIRREGNSVWTWFIRNVMGPYRLSSRRVDRIVANPPWVEMASVQDERRKRTLEGFAQRSDIDLWQGGPGGGHLDLAQLFVRRCRDRYLADRDRNPAAWLVKRSALGGGNWARFREWHRPILAQTVDLDELRPFGGGDARRCCVLFERRPSGWGGTGRPGRWWRGGKVAVTPSSSRRRRQSRGRRRGSWGGVASLSFVPGRWSRRRCWWL